MESEEVRFDYNESCNYNNMIYDDTPVMARILCPA